MADFGQILGAAGTGAAGGYLAGQQFAQNQAAIAAKNAQAQAQQQFMDSIQSGRLANSDTSTANLNNYRNGEAISYIAPYTEAKNAADAAGIPIGPPLQGPKGSPYEGMLVNPNWRGWAAFTNGADRNTNTATNNAANVQIHSYDELLKGAIARGNFNKAGTQAGMDGGSPEAQSQIAGQGGLIPTFTPPNLTSAGPTYSPMAAASNAGTPAPTPNPQSGQMPAPSVANTAPPSATAGAPPAQAPQAQQPYPGAPAPIMPPTPATNPNTPNMPSLVTGQPTFPNVPRPTLNSTGSPSPTPNPATGQVPINANAPVAPVAQGSPSTPIQPTAAPGAGGFQPVGPSSKTTSTNNLNDANAALATIRATYQGPLMLAQTNKDIADTARAKQDMATSLETSNENFMKVVRQAPTVADKQMLISQRNAAMGQFGPMLYIGQTTPGGHTVTADDYGLTPEDAAKMGQAIATAKWLQMQTSQAPAKLNIAQENADANSSRAGTAAGELARQNVYDHFKMATFVSDADKSLASGLWAARKDAYDKRTKAQSDLAGPDFIPSRDSNGQIEVDSTTKKPIMFDNRQNRAAAQGIINDANKQISDYDNQLGGIYNKYGAAGYTPPNGVLAPLPTRAPRNPVLHPNVPPGNLGPLPIIPNVVAPDDDDDHASLPPALRPNLTPQGRQTARSIAGNPRTRQVAANAGSDSPAHRVLRQFGVNV